MTPTGRYVLERITYAADPSAERAYEYGSRHFNSVDRAAYNIDYAEYFYREAIAQDDTYPLAHHQLARINFLRGNFFSALEEINREIQIAGDRNPHAYYVRGLIRGYAGDYRSAADDFARFLSLVPTSWAATNDLAWVLMRSDRYEEAVRILEPGVARFPENAWLLNSYAIALYEEEQYEEAKEIAQRAQAAVEQLTPEDWSAANPGNDPRIAAEGLETFRITAIRNLRQIAQRTDNNEVQ